MNESSRSVEVLRMSGGRLDRANDRVAIEAPLEVRLNGHSFAVIMRTPGQMPTSLPDFCSPKA